MKLTTLIAMAALSVACTPQKTENQEEPKRFNIKKDLLLGHYDCKTDVDDLHTVAAMATMLTSSDYRQLNFHGVAGTYGVQEGLYVPGNELFELAFGESWSDAHTDFEQALNEVVNKVKKTLKQGGDIWIAEAGQSDFSSAVVKRIIKEMPQTNTKKRIHIVQHSDWNEKVTAEDKLTFAKENTDYNKIPDGNAVGNGTPGFRSEEVVDWQSNITDEKLIAIWQLAIELGNQFNGVDGRYNNEAVAKGGLDFSDQSEVCWIMNIEDIKDANKYFSRFSN